MQALMACGSRYGGNEGARHALTLCSTPVVEPLPQNPSTMARWSEERQSSGLEGWKVWTMGGHVLTPWVCHRHTVVRRPGVIRSDFSCEYPRLRSQERFRIVHRDLGTQSWVNRAMTTCTIRFPRVTRDLSYQASFDISGPLDWGNDGCPHELYRTDAAGLGDHWQSLFT